MSALESVLTAGGAALVTLALTLGLLALVMPFFIWQIHSRLVRIEQQLEDANFVALDTRLLQETIAMIAKQSPMAGEPATRAALVAIDGQRQSLAALQRVIVSERKTIIGELLTRFLVKTSPQ